MNLQLLPGTLTQSCYATLQEMYDDFFAKGAAVFPAEIKGILIQDATPAPAFETGYVWARTIAGIPDGRMYIFSNGVWRARHPDFEGKVVMWEGSLSGIATLDGGNASPPSDIAGPFWEEVTEMQARFPLHPGTFPSTTAVAVGDAGGSETVALAGNQNGPHQHFVVNPDLGELVGATPVTAAASVCLREVNGVNIDYVLYGTPTAPTLGLTSSAGSGTGHNNIPPYYSIYFIRRTSRLWYVAP